MNIILASVYQSPLFRNLATIPTDLNQITHHISQNGFAYSMDKILLSPENTGRGADGTFEFRLPQYGYLNKVILRLKYRIYPYSRCQVTPVFPLYWLVSEITLKASNRPLQTIYGPECLIQDAYFHEPEEAAAKLGMHCNPPADDNYASFAALFKRYYKKTSDNTFLGRSTVKSSDVEIRDNSNAKYVHPFEPFNPQHWGDPSSPSSATYYGVVTHHMVVPLSSTHNLKNNFDLKFVQQMDLYIKFQSQLASSNPLYQAWGSVLLQPTNEAANQPANGVSNVMFRGATRVLPYPKSALSAVANFTWTETQVRGNWFHSRIVGLDGSDTDSGDTYGTYAPAAYISDPDTGALETAGGAAITTAKAVLDTESFGVVPDTMMVGTTDFDLDHYHYTAAGAHNVTSSTTKAEDWTDEYYYASMQLKAWVLARFYLAFPWLMVDKADSTHNFTAEAHLGDLYTAGEWTTTLDDQVPTDIVVNGGKSSAAPDGVPNKTYFEPELICYFWQPHSTIREKITMANYDKDEPATLLQHSCTAEVSGESYGGANSSYAVGEKATYNLRTADLVYNIAILALDDTPDDELVWGTVHSDPGCTSGAAAPSAFGATSDPGVGTRNTTTAPTSWSAKSNVASYKVRTDNTDDLVGIGFRAEDLLTAPDIDTVSQMVRKSVQAPQSHARLWEKGVLRWTKTVLPTYASFETSGAVLWSYTNESSDDFTDFVPEQGKGNPHAEAYMDMISIHYNPLERQGMLTTPDRLPDLIRLKYKPNSALDEARYRYTVGTMQEYLQALNISFSMNPTDQESASGAISMQALNAPRIYLIYDRAVRVYIYAMNYQLIQIDGHTGGVSVSLSI